MTTVTSELDVTAVTSNKSSAVSMVVNVASNWVLSALLVWVTPKHRLSPNTRKRLEHRFHRVQGKGTNFLRANHSTAKGRGMAWRGADENVVDSRRHNTNLKERDIHNTVVERQDVATFFQSTSGCPWHQTRDAHGSAVIAARS